MGMYCVEVELAAFYTTPRDAYKYLLSQQICIESEKAAVG